MSPDDGIEGTWRPVGLIQRWDARPTTGEVSDLTARMRATPKRDLDVHRFVACPTCGARTDERCKSAGGNPTADHTARLVSVRCLCGDRVAPRKQYCEPCREKARKATYWRREVRRPTVERRAS